MKGIYLLSFFCFIIFSGCSLRERETQLDRKLAEVNEREQQLALRQQTLEAKEQQLNEREKILDSTTKKIAGDSLILVHPNLPGTWNVKMQCIQTNCQGSAVGDTKNEQWDIRFQDNNIIAGAISNNKLVRVYSGTYSNNTIKLTSQEDSVDSPDTKMTVTLQINNEKDITGQREIIQPGGCRILYSLDLKKQQQK